MQNSPIMAHFYWSQENSYLLCMFKFAYNNFVYIATSTTATLVRLSPHIFLFMTTVTSFLYSLKCNLGYVEPLHKLFD